MSLSKPAAMCTNGLTHGKAALQVFPAPFRLPCAPFRCGFRPLSLPIFYHARTSQARRFPHFLHLFPNIILPPKH